MFCHLTISCHFIFTWVSRLLNADTLCLIHITLTTTTAQCTVWSVSGHFCVTRIFCCSWLTDVIKILFEIEIFSDSATDRAELHTWLRSTVTDSSNIFLSILPWPGVDSRNLKTVMPRSWVFTLSLGTCAHPMAMSFSILPATTEGSSIIKVESSSTHTCGSHCGPGSRCGSGPWAPAQARHLQLAFGGLGGADGGDVRGCYGHYCHVVTPGPGLHWAMWQSVSVQLTVSPRHVCNIPDTAHIWTNVTVLLALSSTEAGPGPSYLWLRLRPAQEYWNETLATHWTHAQAGAGPRPASHRPRQTSRQSWAVWCEWGRSSFHSAHRGPKWGGRGGGGTFLSAGEGVGKVDWPLHNYIPHIVIYCQP